MSANILILQSMFLQISFTYTWNSSGPKTLSCGTTKFALTSLDSWPLTLTHCVQSTRNSLTQTITVESTPNAGSSVSSQSWWNNFQVVHPRCICSTMSSWKCRKESIHNIIVIKCSYVKIVDYMYRAFLWACCILGGPCGVRIRDVVHRGTELELQLRRGVGHSSHTCNNPQFKSTGAY
jgi:hypothetical protein